MNLVTNIYGATAVGDSQLPRSAKLQIKSSVSLQYQNDKELIGCYRNACVKNNNGKTLMHFAADCL